MCTRLPIRSFIEEKGVERGDRQNQKYHMSFQSKTACVLPYLCKQNCTADDETENTVKERFQQVPFPEQRVEGGTQSVTEQSNHS